jgi:hypothetical protein
VKNLILHILALFKHLIPFSFLELENEGDVCSSVNLNMLLSGEYGIQRSQLLADRYFLFMIASNDHSNKVDVRQSRIKKIVKVMKAIKPKTLIKRNRLRDKPRKLPKGGVPGIV